LIGNLDSKGEALKNSKLKDIERKGFYSSSAPGKKERRDERAVINSYSENRSSNEINK
jgi:hypothetical protein